MGVAPPLAFALGSAPALSSAPTAAGEQPAWTAHRSGVDPFSSLTFTSPPAAVRVCRISDRGFASGWFAHCCAARIIGCMSPFPCAFGDMPAFRKSRTASRLPSATAWKNMLSV